MPTTHEIAAEINRRWTELSRDGSLNREETIEQIIRTSLDSSARCIYCNSGFNLTTEEGKEAITNHIMSCDKNPMVAIKVAAEGVLDEHQEFISKHNAITAMLARFLIAHRDTHRCWLDSFVECGAVTIDWNANPYGEVRPVKL